MRYYRRAACHDMMSEIMLGQTLGIAGLRNERKLNQNVLVLAVWDWGVNPHVGDRRQLPNCDESRRIVLNTMPSHDDIPVEIGKKIRF